MILVILETVGTVWTVVTIVRVVKVPTGGIPLQKVEKGGFV